MRAKSVTCLVLLLSCLMNACTTMQPVTTSNAESPDASQIAVDELRAGDRVSLTTSDGATHDLTVIEVDDQVLRGADCEGCSPIAIPVSGIASLDVERVDVLRSAGVILSVVIVIALIQGPNFSPGL